MLLLSAFFCKRLLQILTMTAAAAVDTADIVAKLKSVCADLRALRETVGNSEAGEKALLAMLKRLSVLPVTAQTLKESGAGREVNDPFIRTHPSAAVRDRSREVVNAWKAAVGAAVPKPPVQTSGAGKQAEATTQAREATAAPVDRGKAEQEVKSPAEAGAKKRTPSPEKLKRSSDDSLAAEAASKAKKAKTKETASSEVVFDGPNEAIAVLFGELSSFEFKKGEKFKGVAYKKVATALRIYGQKVKSGAEAKALPDIALASAAKIDEFLQSGKIERLEKYKRGEMD